MDEETRKGRELDALEIIAAELERLRMLKEYVDTDERGPGLSCAGALARDHEEESMAETITMADVLYVPVDDQGEPYRWGPDDEVTVSAFGDFWRCRRSLESKGKAIRALALEDLQELLRSQWSDVTEIAYRPSADSYIKDRDTILQTVIEGVTDR